MSSTRTSSPYFSPNSIIAPSFCASSIGITRHSQALLARISALTMSSTRRISSSLIGCGVDEVEARLVGIDLRAFLLHVGAEHFAQRLVHQVGGGMVAHGARARQGIDPRRDAIADFQRAGPQHAVVAEDGGLDLLRVLDGEDAAAGRAVRRGRRPGRRTRRRTACRRAPPRPSRLRSVP